MSKRAEIREKRRRAQTRRRLVFIVVLFAAALVVAALLIYPSVAPVGDIVVITPQARPRAEGRQAGVSTAPVLIELYEDFQCPGCRYFNEEVVPLLVQEYVGTGRARIVFRQFPFIGRESSQASNASMCADEQGRFWDYYDILFANQSGENRGAFADRRLVAFAETLGLDMQTFRTCFDNRAHQDEIDAERSAGIQLGVATTPTIAVNGQIIQGSQPELIPTFDILKAAIDSILATPTQTP